MAAEPDGALLRHVDADTDDRWSTGSDIAHRASRDPRGITRTLHVLRTHGVVEHDPATTPPRWRLTAAGIAYVARHRR